MIVPSSPRVLAERRLVVTRRPAWPRGKFEVAGKASWFNDGTNSATGRAGGIATRTPAGGYWWVKAPNGTVVVHRQNDYGPATWTGRWLDLTPTAVRAHGYNPDSFPTDVGTWTGRFLGYRLPRGIRVGPQHLSTLGICGFSGRVWFTIVKKGVT